MSGSSLDGLDIVYTHLEEVRGQWSFDIQNADCMAYDAEWLRLLKNAHELPVTDFLRLHTRYGRYLAAQVNAFMHANELEHKVDFIATHGHTVFHEPGNHTTFQLGDGSVLAAVTGLPVISDLRALDVALGGQCAPIVPVGDKLLFHEYDYLLNLGGIANLTVKNGAEMIAFDVCPANQVLNVLAQKAGMDYDADGLLAASGNLLADVLDDLNEQPYYKQPAPKSLSNGQAMELVFPSMTQSSHAVNDMLHTAVQHIAEQVLEAVKRYPVAQKEHARMLVTGGGAFNRYMVSRIQELLDGIATVTVPDAQTVKYKEAVVMALIGALRWREETNVFSSVTGASRDSISGALWMGHAY